MTAPLNASLRQFSNRLEEGEARPVCQVTTGTLSSTNCLGNFHVHVDRGPQRDVPGLPLLLSVTSLSTASRPLPTRGGVDLVE